MSDEYVGGLWGRIVMFASNKEFAASYVSSRLVECVFEMVEA